MSLSKCEYEENYVDHAPHLDECKARRRRIRRFKAIAKLDVVPFRKWDKSRTYRKFYNYFRYKSERGVSLDHVTMFERSGIPFLLTEPYVDDCELIHNDYVGIKVPDQLAPYCGSWSSVPGARPGTSSYLYAPCKHYKLLLQIYVDLLNAAKSEPNWNFLDNGVGND